MIQGYFKASDSNPYLPVEVIIPKYSINQRINFLIDTGASTTIINEGDALRIGLNFNKLQKADIKLGGIGGFADTYEVETILHCKEKQIYSGVIYILNHQIPKELDDHEAQKKRKWFLSQPSLLGKNIIYDYGLFMYRLNNKILLLERDEVPVELK